MPNMSEKDLFVAKSKFHGKGLFVKKDVKKGQIILTIKGKRKRKQNKTLQDVFSNPNWVGFNEYQWIDPSSPFKFLNHSCDPNGGIKGSVRLYALRDIKAGEEITFDYSTSEADQRWFLNCRCGSKKCRKRIQSIQFLPSNVYDAYLPYIPTGLKFIYNNK
jgi:uncharacterized protein